jgi:hypothetical protein
MVIPCIERVARFVQPLSPVDTKNIRTFHFEFTSERERLMLIMHGTEKDDKSQD